MAPNYHLTVTGQAGNEEVRKDEAESIFVNSDGQPASSNPNEEERKSLERTRQLSSTEEETKAENRNTLSWPARVTYHQPGGRRQSRGH